MGISATKDHRSGGVGTPVTGHCCLWRTGTSRQLGLKAGRAPGGPRPLGNELGLAGTAEGPLRLVVPGAGRGQARRGPLRLDG